VGVGGVEGGAVGWTGDEALIAVDVLPVDVLPSRRLAVSPCHSLLNHRLVSRSLASLIRSLTHSMLPPVIIIIGMRV